MGVVAILSDAVIWAATGTFLTAKLAKIDFLTIVTFRSIFAVTFIVAATFALGAQDDLWHMDPNIVWQLALAGLAAYVIAEPAYTLTLAFLGLTRGYTAVIGLNSVASFVLPAIFLGEAIGWRDAVGGVVILSGVYLVAFYGRAAVQARPTPPPPRRLPWLRPATAQSLAVLQSRPSRPLEPPAAVPQQGSLPIVRSAVAARAGRAAESGIPIPGIGKTLPWRAVGLALAAVILSGIYHLVVFHGRPARNEQSGASSRRGVRFAFALLIIGGLYRFVFHGRAGARSVQAASPPRRLQWPNAASRKPASPATRSADAAQAGRSVSGGVRIPGIGITLPRLAVGLTIALITALGWAGDATILRAVAPGIHVAPVALAQLWPAMIVFIVWFTIARRGRPLVGIPSKGTASLIGGTGALTTGLGTMLVIIAVKDIGAGPTAVLFAMSTIFALPLGVIFLKERVTIWGVLGVCVAVAGVAILAI
ncbi:MAG: DMT family transporter [Chloroflexi bacterium]|nr:DMT family transporter [Chloroflexota bacterium]